MHTQGIDKIAIATKEFRVDANSHLLRVTPHTYAPNDPNPKDEAILFNDQRGRNAHYNHKNFNLDISDLGLSIHFNPSKCLHPYNLTNDSNEIQQVWDFIRDEAKAAGVLIAPDNELKLWRVDVARNDEMSNPAAFYAPLFQSLRGKRMHKVEYSDTYTFRNTARDIEFYDKTQDVTAKQPGVMIADNVMRCELRAKNSKSVGSIYKLNDLSTLLKVGEEYRIEKYTTTITNTIFAPGNRSDQLAFSSMNHPDQIRELASYIKKYPRNALLHFAAAKGLDVILDIFGNIENYQLCMIQAGISEKDSYKQVRRFQQSLDFASLFTNKTKEQNITRMYDEVYTKFAV